MSAKFLWIFLILILIVGGIIFVSQGMRGGSQASSQSQAINQPTTNSQTEVTTVTVTQNGFEPQEVRVKAGTRVVWINKSGGAVTVSSAPHPTHTDYPPLNLGQFEDGASVSLVFDKSGTYKYHNHLNPSQFGQVVVE